MTRNQDLSSLTKSSKTTERTDPEAETGGISRSRAADVMSTNSALRVDMARKTMSGCPPSIQSGVKRVLYYCIVLLLKVDPSAQGWYKWVTCTICE